MQYPIGKEMPVARNCAGHTPMVLTAIDMMAVFKKIVSEAVVKKRIALLKPATSRVINTHFLQRAKLVYEPAAAPIAVATIGFSCIAVSNANVA